MLRVRPLRKGPSVDLWSFDRTPLGRFLRGEAVDYSTPLAPVFTGRMIWYEHGFLGEYRTRFIS
jgi:hypothetical protein